MRTHGVFGVLVALTLTAGCGSRTDQPDQPSRPAEQAPDPDQFIRDTRRFGYTGTNLEALAMGRTLCDLLGDLLDGSTFDWRTTAEMLADETGDPPSHHMALFTTATENLCPAADETRP